MKKDRRIYSIIGAALCVAVLSFSVNVMNEGSGSGNDIGSLEANAAGLGSVSFIGDPVTEGPGAALTKDAIVIADAPAEDGETQAAYKTETDGTAAASDEASGVQASEVDAEAGTSGDSEAEGEAASVNAEDIGPGVAADTAEETAASSAAYADGEEIGLSSDWEFASFSAISSGKAVYYRAVSEPKNIVIAVNAGHGTSGGSSVKTWCHLDKTPKVTGGTTAAGATKAVAVSSGMNFKDGTAEHTVTLKMAKLLRDKLINNGYDVLMLRDGEDVQLDNVARTVMANNIADCHIALHWDSDGLSSDKGCFYMSVPDGLKSMYPVSGNWQRCEALGDALIEGLRGQGLKIWGSNPLDMDLTQTSFSTIASVDIELGNQCSSHTDADLELRAKGLLDGINSYFGY